MLALLTAAFALECREVVNMETAGVPPEEIVRQMNVAGTPIDRDFMACLVAHGAGESIVNSAWRLEIAGPKRDVPLDATHVVTLPTWVEVDLTCGSVTVEGADTKTIAIHGRGDANAKLTAAPTGDGLRVDVGSGSIVNGVDPAQLPVFSRDDRGAKPAPIERPCADLDIRLPRQSRVVVKSARADVRVRFVDGPVELTSHFGNLDLVGRTEEVVLKTTSGNIRSDTGAKHVDIETVSGMVEVSVGSEARVVASSISGPIWVWGGPVQRLSVNSVSGDLRLNAAVQDSGNALLQSHKGNVEAHVPSGEIAATSHEGVAQTPSRLVRPDGPTQRVKHGTALRPPDRFGSLELLSAETYGLWAKEHPERWWFRRGAVVSRTIEQKASGFTLSASSFSGNVRVQDATAFPAPTGPVIAQMEAVAPRLDACVDDQLRRRPGSKGHAVLTMRLRDDGTVVEAVAPASAYDPKTVEDGAFSSCLVRAVEKLQFEAGGEAEIRWPVPFHPPLAMEPVSPPSGSLSPMVDVRRKPVP